MMEHQDIDSMHEQDTGTVLWLVPIGSDRVAWTQEKGQPLDEGEQVWHLYTGEPEHVVHLNRE